MRIFVKLIKNLPLRALTLKNLSIRWRSLRTDAIKPQKSAEKILALVTGPS